MSMSSLKIWILLLEDIYEITNYIHAHTYTRLHEDSKLFLLKMKTISLGMLCTGRKIIGSIEVKEKEQQQQQKN